MEFYNVGKLVDGYSQHYFKRKFTKNKKTPVTKLLLRENRGKTTSKFYLQPLKTTNEPKSGEKEVQTPGRRGVIANLTNGRGVVPRVQV